jgi:pimeloyl-ACP methyl ester carboxylesterase
MFTDLGTSRLSRATSVSPLKDAEERPAQSAAHAPSEPWPVPKGERRVIGRSRQPPHGPAARHPVTAVALRRTCACAWQGVVMAGWEGALSLLCVPGLGLDGRAWRPTLRALHGSVEHQEDVVALLPGYGLRPSAGDDLRPTSLGARLTARWLTDVSAPIVLMGHSASCQIVARAACLGPDQVSALVLVGPTTDPRAASWPQIGYRWLRTAIREPPGELPLLARTYTSTGLLWMLCAMDAARREDLRASVRELGCPVFVVRGRYDRICPQDWAHEVVAAAPSESKILPLDDGAHMVPLTHGEILAAAVRGALG